MSAGACAAPVEEEYHHEEKRDQQAMDSKQSALKINSWGFWLFPSNPNSHKLSDHE
jgi:hypothetical protein